VSLGNAIAVRIVIDREFTSRLLSSVSVLHPKSFFQADSLTAQPIQRGDRDPVRRDQR